MDDSEFLSPSLIGPAARAWLAAPYVPHPSGERWPSVSLWLVVFDAPLPVPSRYVVSAIHLRAVTGMAPLVGRHLSGASHEICICAADTSMTIRAECPLDWIRAAQPVRPDLAMQLHDMADMDVSRLTQRVVESFCFGLLTPDSIFLEASIKQAAVRIKGVEYAVS